jgi:hypothetical protein
MADGRPAWARRMTNERKARGWSQTDAVRAMRAHAPVQLAGDASLIRQWKRWEAGEVEPDRGKTEPFYKPIIAAMFGTVTHAMFPVAPSWGAASAPETADRDSGVGRRAWPGVPGYRPGPTRRDDEVRR